VERRPDADNREPARALGSHRLRSAKPRRKPVGPLRRGRRRDDRSRCPGHAAARVRAAV